MKEQNRKTAGGFRRMTMDMNEKMAREIAQQLGLGGSKNVSRQAVQSLEGKNLADSRHSLQRTISGQNSRRLW